MFNNGITATQPPFYWKVKEPEKDYMYENYQRIRKINAQNKQNRGEPMKAAFIPGVTKNAKYAHVTSRVGEFLRSNVERGAGDESNFVSSRSKLQSSSSASKLLPNKFGGQQQRQQPRSSIRTSSNGDINGGVNRRLSRSSSDLATMTANNRTKLLTSSASAGQASQTSLLSQKTNIGVEGPGNYVPRAKRKPRGLQPQEESVYNWRFNDQAINPSYNVPHPAFPNVKTLHRVEYLPCDGICADETVGEAPTSDGSGRSSSRTSRGCNTEETRIIDDFQNLDLQQPNRSQSLEQFPPPAPATTSSIASKQQHQHHNQRPQCFEQGWMTQDQNHQTNEDDDDYVDDGGRGDFSYKRGSAQNLKKTSSSTSAVIKSSRSRDKEKERQTSSTSVEFPHSLGSVPKYLKQRQEEWKVQEEADKRAADLSNAAPPGHVLMDDKERIETLASLKKNYNELINELNRVPIRIDTMRVRDHKIKLEQQLQKLEQAMVVFARPRVYIKLNAC